MAAAEDGKFLGGGQTLLPTMKQRLAAPSDLVDVTKISRDERHLRGWGRRFYRCGDHPCRGSVFRSGEDRRFRGSRPLLGGIGDPAVRHMGTIGGSIANNDPAADYPAALVALGATVTTSKRELSAEDFFTGMFETALEDDEVVVSVKFPGAAASAYAKYPNPASRYAMAGVFVAKGSDGSVKVAVTGAGQDGVFRMQAMETALASNFSPDAVAGIAPDADGLLADLHGSC